MQSQILNYISIAIVNIYIYIYTTPIQSNVFINIFSHIMYDQLYSIQSICFNQSIFFPYMSAFINKQDINKVIFHTLFLPILMLGLQFLKYMKWSSARVVLVMILVIILCDNIWLMPSETIYLLNLMPVLSCNITLEHFT